LAPAWRRPACCAEEAGDLQQGAELHLRAERLHRDPGKFQQKAPGFARGFVVMAEAERDDQKR
jgi:hypothetical protein